MTVNNLRRTAVSPFLLGVMIYSLSLRSAGLIVGLLLVVVHLIALLHAKGARQLLRLFPRSRAAGMVLLTVDAVWAFLLIAEMDLGEFTSWRHVFLIAIVAGYILTVFYVEEFLAVRALGILLLLAAEPLLEAAFLHPQASRFLLTVLAYAWATAGLFWVGIPYLLRDQIGWVSGSEKRWRAAAFGGLLYGAAVLVCALTLYGV